MKRLYILEYDFYPGLGGIYGTSKKEEVTRFFLFKERQLFIEDFQRVSADTTHYTNVRTYIIGNYEKFESTNDMPEIINAL